MASRKEPSEYRVVFTRKSDGEDIAVFAGIRDLGLAKRIFFAGMRDDVEDAVVINIEAWYPDPSFRISGGSWYYVLNSVAWTLDAPEARA